MIDFERIVVDDVAVVVQIRRRCSTRPAHALVRNGSLVAKERRRRVDSILAGVPERRLRVEAVGRRVREDRRAGEIIEGIGSRGDTASLDG
jgi:hypothetical protein